MRRHSTYAFNNPIRFIDPDRMMPITTQQLADAQTYARGMVASAATDDANFQTDGYSELSHGQRSEVGDTGRYTASSGGGNGGLRGLWNQIRGKGYLNYAEKELQNLNESSENASLVEGEDFANIIIYDASGEVARVMHFDVEFESGGTARILKHSKNGKKIIVLGEDMKNRVIPYVEKDWCKVV